MIFSLVPLLTWRLEQKRRVITAVSDELEIFFAKQGYGSSVKMFVIGIVCMDDEFEPFYPVGPPKYSKKHKEFEYSLKLDYEAFLNADTNQAKKILGTAIFNSVKAIEGSKIGDFDLPRFEENLQSFLESRGWLLAGMNASVDPANCLTITEDSLENEEYELPAPLSEETFWSIVDESRTKMGNEIDTERQSELISEILSTKTEDQIVGFELMLRELIRTANHFNVMAACKICDEFVSDDNYLYFRAGLIFFGRDVFYATLENPDACAEALVLNTEGEYALYIADNAFTKKFGDNSSKPLPRDLAVDCYNYDLEKEDPKGEDCTTEALPGKYPKLWQAAKNKQSC